MLATMFLSMGVPMINGGDELSRTARGNNNTYCQDNDLNWYRWSDMDVDFYNFVRRLIAIRKKQPVLQRRKFFLGHASKYSGIKDIVWFSPDGRDMSDAEWHSNHSRAIGYVMEGASIDEMDQSGKRIIGNTLLVLINGAFNEVTFKLPFHRTNEPWSLMLTTTRKMNHHHGNYWQGGETFVLPDHTMALFKLHTKHPWKNH